MQRMIVLFACALLLGGCVTTTSEPKEDISTLPVEELASRVTENGTKFDTFITYRSIRDYFDGASYYRLRSWKYKDRPIKDHQLYVSIFYFDDWIYYDTAADDNAQTIKVTLIDRKVLSCSSSCSFRESVGIDVGLKYLLSKQDTGFEIRLTSRKGTGAVIVAVPANYIKGHLMAIGAI